jgi:hypothetical protein
MTWQTFALALLLCLAACGVRVEVATPVVPTPTPIVIPMRDYSGDSVWREQAAPRIAFTKGSAPQIQLFMERAQPQAYVLQYGALWITASYSATWFDTLLGSTDIRLNLYTRPTSNDAWELRGTDQRSIVTDRWPASVQDALAVPLYMDEAQTTLQIRAEVRLTAIAEEGSTPVTLSDANEFTVMSLGDPGEIEVNTESMQSGPDPYTDTVLLLDWRGWEWGPCAHAEWADDALRETLIEACEALNTNDLQTARDLVWGTGDAASGELRGYLYQSAGALSYVLGDYSSARDLFSAAAGEFSVLEGFTHHFVMALHNLFTAQVMLEDVENAYTTIQQLVELHQQFYDEAGLMLTRANTGRFSDNLDELYEADTWFSDRDMPQGDVLDVWITQLENE